MKRNSSINRFLTDAINSATRSLNAAYGVFQEVTAPDGPSETIRYRLSPFGEFPVKDVHGRDIIQVVDAAAGETMAINFGSLAGKIATFFRGVPMYEGHADDEDWLKKNPGHKASAVGRIKSIEVVQNGNDEDGIWVTAALNSDGIGMLGGDAPKYTGHSPHWRLTPIPGRPGHYRPILLWSDALTNTPNIVNNSVALNSLQGVCDEDAEAMHGAAEEQSPDAGQSGASENQEQNDMKLTPDALKALGFAPEAEPTPEEISAAIVALFQSKAAAETAKGTAEDAMNEAKRNETAACNALNEIRSAAVETVIDAAVREGRITEADKPAWTTALNTSFVSERDKLAKLMPVMNTRNHVAGAGRRDMAPTDAMNTAAKVTEAVVAFAAEKGMDITSGSGWRAAFDACRAAKPEVFAR